MIFGEAIEAMKHRGARMQRAGWNGRGMWIAIQTPDEHSKMQRPYIYMSDAQGLLVPWLASQTDILSDDWQVG
jgi:glutamate synthase domain-containing protein 1